MKVADRWWISTLATIEDPISLEPLRTLRYPPFKCPTDPSLSHDTDCDWFDGLVLANYLCSTASFVHPISRRELLRDECRALDAYCTEHNLCTPFVTRVFDGAQAGDASVSMLQAEAQTVLQSLFASGNTRRMEASQRQAAEAVAADGSLRIVDDDLRPSHDVGVALAAAERAAESFPPLATALPQEEASASASVVVSAGAGSWADGAAGAVLQPPPPPPRAPTAEEVAAAQARRSLERLHRERCVWRERAAAAEAKAAAERAASEAASREQERAERTRQHEWDRALALSDALAAAEAASGRAAAAAARTAEAVAARQLHAAAALQPPPITLEASPCWPLTTCLQRARRRLVVVECAPPLAVYPAHAALASSPRPGGRRAVAPAVALAPLPHAPLTHAPGGACAGDIRLQGSAAGHG